MFEWVSVGLCGRQCGSVGACVGLWVWDVLVFVSCLLSIWFEKSLFCCDNLSQVITRYHYL